MTAEDAEDRRGYKFVRIRSSKSSALSAVENERPQVTHNEISGQIVDAAMRVHSALGPGLLESAYQACLAFELSSRGRQVETEVGLPVRYRDVRLEVGYRIDLLVESLVIVEIKSVSKLMPLHEAQLLSYLRLADKRLGLLINFNVPRLKDGLKRMANGLQE